jgi:hypothetical protein
VHGAAVGEVGARGVEVDVDDAGAEADGDVEGVAAGEEGFCWGG